jgi:hypothetical protein
MLPPYSQERRFSPASASFKEGLELQGRAVALPRLGPLSRLLVDDTQVVVRAGEARLAVLGRGSQVALQGLFSARQVRSGLPRRAAEVVQGGHVGGIELQRGLELLEGRLEILLALPRY